MAAPNIKTIIAEDGYCLLREHLLGVDTAEVANQIGTAMTPWDGGLIQSLSPREEAAPNTYSGNFGLGRFPFHTDLAHWKTPPRYLLLRCQIGYEDVPTLLADGRQLIGALSRDILSRAIFKPRRPRDGAFALMPLLENRAECDLLRWDEIFLRPASRVATIADEQVRNWLNQTEPFAIALYRPGDTLILDNWRMLHARSPIPAGRENRSLERVYLEYLR